MYCKNCGKELDEEKDLKEEKVCPHCGAKQEKETKVIVNVTDARKKKLSPLMKGVIGLICVLTLISVVSGIGGAGDLPTKEIGGNPTNSSTMAETTFRLNETAVFRNLKITATEIKTSYGDTYFGASEGNIYIGINFTIENISNENVTISSILLFDAYVDGIKCEYSLFANTAFDGNSLDGDLAPGKKLVGYYATEIPEVWDEFELQVKSNYWSSSKAIFKFSAEDILL